MSLDEIDEINIYPNNGSSFEVNIHYSEKDINGEMHSSVVTFHNMYLSLELSAGLYNDRNIKLTFEGN